MSQRKTDLAANTFFTAPILPEDAVIVSQSDAGVASNPEVGSATNSEVRLVEMYCLKQENHMSVIESEHVLFYKYAELLEDVKLRSLSEKSSNVCSGYLECSLRQIEGRKRNCCSGSNIVSATLRNQFNMSSALRRIGFRLPISSQNSSF
jgi:hypothetical protein